MPRIRLTQVFPCLLPLRIKSKTYWFYKKMDLQKNKYQLNVEDRQIFNYCWYSISQPIINPNSGADISYQYNKEHNLKIASKTINNRVIDKDQVLSFCYLTRYADKDIPYKDGLIVIDEKMIAQYGGGLCQLSNMLYEAFLHTPLQIIERHPHNIETIPPTSNNPLFGIDATIAVGWCDLKIKNPLDVPIQVQIDFSDDHYIHISICSTQPLNCTYSITNENLRYIKKSKYPLQIVDVYRIVDQDNKITKEKLYTNKCYIAYPLNTKGTKS